MYANTHKQDLSKHLFAVGYVARGIVQQLIEHETINKHLSNEAYAAGVWHDSGKADAVYQDWVIDSTSDETHSWENYPRHNEISHFLYYSLNANKHKSYVSDAVYFHHEKPYRKEELVFQDIDSKVKDKQIFDKVRQLVTEVNRLAANYDGNLPQIELLPERNDPYSGAFPLYKRYPSGNEYLDEFQDVLKVNAYKDLVRSALIKADRVVSAISATELNEYIEYAQLDDLVHQHERDDSLLNGLEVCLNDFEQHGDQQRNQQQTATVERILEQQQQQYELNNEPSISVLGGAAGCGKTKIALEVAYRTGAKQLIWICPTVSICLGMYEELRSVYLPHGSVEIATGEFKLTTKNGQESPTVHSFQSDVVVTNIDTVTRLISTFQDSVSFIDFMKSFVVFDEFHEFTTTQGFNLLFAELIAAKKLRVNEANTLLVSATPNRVFCDFIGVTQIQRCASWHTGTFELVEVLTQDATEYLQDAPLSKGRFIISNTAIAAQLGTIQHSDDEQALLLHSKYTQRDKKQQLDLALTHFGKDSEPQFDGIRSSTIMRASLNISANHMLLEMNSAENTLQPLGRLDRFDKTGATNILEIVVSKSSEPFLNSMNLKASTQAWITFLHEQGAFNKPLTLNDIYALYDAFYVKESTLAAVSSDLLKALNQSATLINKNILEPVCFPNKSNNQSTQVRIKTRTVRVNGRFVNMLVGYVDSAFNLEFSDRYVIEDDSDYMTYELNKIEYYGRGDNKKNLAEYMADNHHKVFKECSKHALPDAKTVIAKAKSQDNPIYLSYQPLLDDKRNENGIYYVKTKQQPIGAIRLSDLTQCSNHRGDKQ